MCVWEDWIIGVFVERKTEQQGGKALSLQMEFYKCPRTAGSSKSLSSKASMSLEPSSLD